MNDQEFTEIVSRTKAVVLASIRRYLMAENLTAIDDVVQETYIRAFRSLSKQQFRGDSSLNTWLYTIARNESLRANDKFRRENKLYDRSVQDLDILEELADNKADESRNLLDLDLLNGLLEKIPVKQKEVLVLYADGFKEKEIATRLSISTGTVKSRTARGKDNLRRIWNGGAF